MSLFELKGTVTAVGSAALHSDGSYHNWIQVTGDDGCIFNVSIDFRRRQSNKRSAHRRQGEFYFDKI